MAHQDWIQLVQKQLKTEDITSILNKENLEGIHIHPYYSDNQNPILPLPKIEESTQLVSRFSTEFDENIYAYFIDDAPLPTVKEKSIYVKNWNTLKNASFTDGNRYFSLIDVFQNEQGTENKETTINHEQFHTLQHLPLERKVCIDIALYQNAGASIIQQLAIALLKTQELISQFGKEILPTLIYKVGIGGQYFLEIAKIRALKILINTYSKELGLNEVPYIFAETSLRNKSIVDSENNLIRSTIELAAGMIAGADAVFTNNFNLQENTLLTQEISFKQQVVLAYESIINVFEDAAAGSYFVEEATQQFAEKAWDLFVQIEDEGGFLAQMKTGKLIQMVYTQALTEQKHIAEGKIKLIGVNIYPKLEATQTAESLYNDTMIQPIRWAEMFE